MVNKNVYLYTKGTFADYIFAEQKKLKERAGVKLSTADCTALLFNKVIVPNNISLSDSIKEIELPKLRKLRLKL